ncbi:MAG: DUF3987 domain-containing protein, partial [Yoonia sp.]
MFTKGGVAPLWPLNAIWPASSSASDGTAKRRAYIYGRSTCSDTGFLPRFLMCEPQSTIGSRLQANTKRVGVELEAFSSHMRQILAKEMPMDAQTNALEPRVLELSADARELVAGFSDAVEQAQGAGGSLAHITGTASKVAEQ